MQGRLTSLIRDPICVTPRTPSTTAAHRAEARDPIWPPAFDPLTRATSRRSHLWTCTPFRAASAIAPPDASALAPRPGCHMHMSAHPPERPLPTTRRTGPRACGGDSVRSGVQTNHVDSSNAAITALTNCIENSHAHPDHGQQQGLIGASSPKKINTWPCPLAHHFCSYSIRSSLFVYSIH